MASLSYTRNTTACHFLPCGLVARSVVLAFNDGFIPRGGNGQRMTAIPRAAVGAEAAFTIARASFRDVPAIHTLEKACFGPDAWGYVELALMYVGRGVRLKAVADGQLVGFAAGDGMRWNSRPGDGTGWVTTIGVHPGYQRRGIGEALLLACEAALGQPHVRLTVRASNKPALALYAKFGYQHVSVWHHYYSDDEDGVVMEKTR